MSRFTKIAALFLVLVAVLLAFAAYKIASKPAPKALQIQPVAQVSQAKEAPPQKLYPVVVAAKAIPAGSTLSASVLDTQKWPITPSSAFASDQPLVGKVVRVALKQGDPLTENMLARGLSTYLHDGERAVTIPVDAPLGAAQQVRPGDMVDVFFTLNKNNEVNDTQTRLLLPRVRVLAYGNNSVDGPLVKQDDSRRRTEAPRTAVLAVALARVNDLLLAVRRGKLKLVLRSPKDDTMPDVALFPKNKPVLQGREGLTTEQKQQLVQPENLAYAGASLPQLAASKTKEDETTPSSTPVSGASHHRRRTVQVIRGDKSSAVPY